MLDGIFGARRAPAVTIDHAPENAAWHEVTPRGDEKVRAWLAAEDCEVLTTHGALKARAGEDMIVAYKPREVSVVRRDLFERTYESVGGGVFQKRSDVKMRYFTLDKPVLVQTLEGPQRAEAGDWIMEGVDGELWPVSRHKALRKYKSH